MIHFSLTEPLLDSNNNVIGTDPYLYIYKNDNASGSYDDGIYIYFGDKQPQHISFQM